MKPDETYAGTLDSVKKTVKQLKKLADETGADIDQYSIEYKLYLEDSSLNDIREKTAAKRKNLFEEKSKKDSVTK